MRDQGRLVEWFDDKGYGFIQPNDTKKDRVFLHINDFARRGPRPIEGCALEYTVTADGDGRFRAHNVSYLKVSEIKTSPQNSKQKSLAKSSSKQLKPMQILIAIYIIALGILTAIGLFKSLTLIFIVLINLTTYWFYAQDKESAELGKRRVPEQTLHILAFLGGWPAAWLAQEKLRHKTQKQPFRKIYFCTIVINILLILWLISPLNVLKF